ncbi:MAG: toxin-antitoxin system HicB family antitoxin [Oscillospiraceae bacterium]|nr:toxin-antitoxin system HicB family antitoxin [Oscillospiraceae bacterium]
MAELTLEEYMKLPYPMVIEEDEVEGGYTVYYPDLPGCVTCTDEADKIIPMAEDAKRAWFEASLESGYTPVLPDSTKSYSGKFALRMPKSLHRKLAEHAKDDGVSMNQYCVYLLTQQMDNIHDSKRAG